MQIQDWSDAVSEEDLAAFTAQFNEGLSSIDLTGNTTNFLLANTTVVEFGISNDAEHLEVKAIIEVQYGGKAIDRVSIDVIGIEAVLVSSCAVAGADEDGYLTNTYHKTGRVFSRSDDPIGTQDVAYIIGATLGDMYYMIDESK